MSHSSQTASVPCVTCTCTVHAHAHDVHQMCYAAAGAAANTQRQQGGQRPHATDGLCEKIDSTHNLNDNHQSVCVDAYENSEYV